MNASPRSHRKIILVGIIAAGVMFVFCFALVPLYSLICKKTGINTAVNDNWTAAPGVQESATIKADESNIDITRTVTIQFIAMNHMGMTWDFYPQVKSINVHPGERHTVYFHVKNTLPYQMTVQAIPSMTPTDAIAHFHKIECFCFRNQMLAAHASKEMPMVFQLDRDLPKNIRVITLAYTLFDVTSNAIAKG